VRDSSRTVPADISDDTLVVRIRGGDRPAFDALMDRYADGLLRIAFGYLKSSADAEDLVQDLFLSIWRTREQWQPQGAVMAYLAVAVRRRALNVLKHHRVEMTYAARVADEGAHDDVSAMTPPADAELASSDERATLSALLSQLSDRARMALLLRYDQQQSFAAVGEIMGISALAARQLVWRALEQLRRLHRP